MINSSISNYVRSESMWVMGTARKLWWLLPLGALWAPRIQRPSEMFAICFALMLAGRLQMMRSPAWGTSWRAALVVGFAGVCLLWLTLGICLRAALVG